MNKELIAKHNIKGITVYARPVEGDKKSSNRFKKYEKFYDNQGNLIEYLEYKGGKNIIWEKYVLDSKGQIIEKTIYRCEGWDRARFRSFTQKYEIDQDGNLISPHHSLIKKDRHGNTVETTYYLNGKIKTKRVINANGKPVEEIEYKAEKIIRTSIYNEVGNLLEVRNFDLKGKPLNYSQFEYDKNSNQTRILKVNRTGNISQDRTLKYDNNNNLIEDVDIPKNVYAAYYDVNGMSPEELSKEDTEGYKYVYIYTTKQLLLEHKFYVGGRLLMIYEHEYCFQDD